MKIIPVLHGTFKVDGGAMFGPVPKTMWSKRYPADENNLCTLTMRSLIIETDDRLIMIDTGIGNKHDPKFLSFIYPQLNSMDDILAEHNYKPEDFTDIILTHLHYDHAGGATYKDKEGNIKPYFPKATYWLGEQQWNLLQNPNPREKSALFPEDIIPVKENGQLKLIKGKTEITNGIILVQSNGHTSGMLVPIIQNGAKVVVFAADMIPTIHNLHLPWVSAYDNLPIVLMEEKKIFLQEAVRSGYIIAFEHDLYNAFATVDYDETKDKFIPKETFNEIEI
jgi:glyoxylase-like metal-dependent hydrolase (beta-lactamase superfamily II)